jgi:hypothetical protein
MVWIPSLPAQSGVLTSVAHRVTGAELALHQNLPNEINHSTEVYSNYEALYTCSDGNAQALYDVLSFSLHVALDV